MARHLGTGILQRFLDALRIDLRMPGAARFRLDNREFVVADTRQPVFMADEDEQPFPDQAQERVSLGFAEDRVQPGEPVDVDQVQGKLPPAPCVGGELLAKRVDHLLAAGQEGSPIALSLG